ncbi:MAG TPA: hypothetical protein VK469_14485 [Candidatus Kapabacteria bacterium]|nr:hypothetical protein [Candidatus Kapabacteria bacterium]
MHYRPANFEISIRKACHSCSFGLVKTLCSFVPLFPPFHQCNQRHQRYLMVREGVGIPVDLVVDTEERFERLKGNRYLIYHEVEKYGKTLYERKTASSTMA